MLDTFNNLDAKLQAAIVSACTAVTILFLGWLWRLFYDRFSLSQKLKVEFEFEQKRSIKNEIAKSKTPLLQAAESLNFRLWNLLGHKEEGWLSLSSDEWLKPQHHYIRSFVYKWVSLIYWILKAEKSIGGYDSTVSPKADLLYLKFVKAIKFCLCDRLLLFGLGYESKDTDNHFYIDDLERFASFVEEGESVMPFHKFEEKLNVDIKPVEKVFSFFSRTTHKDRNRSMNMLRALHFLIIQFLNSFGHEYQRTSKEAILTLERSDYPVISMKKELRKFFQKHKIDREMKSIWGQW